MRWAESEASNSSRIGIGRANAGREQREVEVLQVRGAMVVFGMGFF